ncbi:hypothetical protein [Streptomyces sp. SID3212]|uniref:hypothetical protein n=1 Tax=unclassified Streptomyces TaxID=2593676 RepID=UPI0013680E6A|nr:hypothetical protein [Streptomyces sp. SID3212]MYV53476.1 hypothetical protein [Streptomyces sp. SID3212]
MRKFTGTSSTSAVAAFLLTLPAATALLALPLAAAVADIDWPGNNLTVSSAFDTTGSIDWPGPNPVVSPAGAPGTDDIDWP